MIKKFEKFDFEEEWYDEEYDENRYTHFILYSVDDREYLFFIKKKEILYLFVSFYTVNSIETVIDDVTGVKFNGIDYTRFFDDGDFVSIPKGTQEVIKLGKILITNNYDDDNYMYQAYTYDELSHYFKNISFELPDEYS